MKKILIFVNSFNTGGVTAVIKNLYENIDKKYFQIDFVRSNTNINDFDEYVKSQGSKVYYYDRPILCKIPILNYVVFRHQITSQVIKQIVQENYDCIYIHSNLIVGLYVGIRAKIKNRILHVHEAIPDFGDDVNKSLITYLIWKWRQNKYREWSNKLVGDSSKACKVKFGPIHPKGKMYTVINPPINYLIFNKKFYDGVAIADKYDINSTAFNIINVGRIVPVKNQIFLIDLLKYANEIKRTDLYIVGSGPSKQQLIDMAKKYKVDSYLHILPPDTTPGIYTCMDCSVLPSLSEAFGMVAVESQIMKVPVFISENVPEDIDCGLSIKMNLSDGAKKWVERIFAYDYAHIDSKPTKFQTNEEFIQKVSDLF